MELKKRIQVYGIEKENSGTPDLSPCGAIR
jgi:hypothetical protein